VFCDVFQKCVDNKCVRISDNFPDPLLIINGDEFDLKGSVLRLYTNPNILFDNWGVIDGKKYCGNCAFNKGIVSPPHTFFNSNRGLPSSMFCPGGSFDVISLYMTPFNSNLLVTLVGTYRGNQVGETVNLQLGSPAGPPIQFESQLSAFRNIDKLTFTYNISLYEYFVMDDLTININSPCNI